MLAARDLGRLHACGRRVAPCAASSRRGAGPTWGRTAWCARVRVRGRAREEGEIDDESRLSEHATFWTVCSISRSQGPKKRGALTRRSPTRHRATISENARPTIRGAGTEATGAPGGGAWSRSGSHRASPSCWARSKRVEPSNPRPRRCDDARARRRLGKIEDDERHLFTLREVNDASFPDHAMSGHLDELLRSPGSQPVRCVATAPGHVVVSVAGGKYLHAFSARTPRPARVGATPTEPTRPRRRSVLRAERTRRTVTFES